MLGDVRFTMFAWGFDTFLLGDEFFERCAWGCGFQGLVCLGTSISAPLLLGDLLGVDLLGSVRQGCIVVSPCGPLTKVVVPTFKCLLIGCGGYLLSFDWFGR